MFYQLNNSLFSFFKSPRQKIQDHTKKDTKQNSPNRKLDYIFPSLTLNFSNLLLHSFIFFFYHCFLISFSNRLYALCCFRKLTGLSTFRPMFKRLRSHENNNIKGKTINIIGTTSKSWSTLPEFSSKTSILTPPF